MRDLVEQAQGEEFARDGLARLGRPVRVQAVDDASGDERCERSRRRVHRSDVKTIQGRAQKRDPLHMPVSVACRDVPETVRPAPSP